jgi:hypothetical protein
MSRRDHHNRGPGCEYCFFVPAGLYLYSSNEGTNGIGLLLLSILFILILAFIGIFLCIAMGMYYIAALFQKHFHILRKWNLSQAYVVEDLAEGAIPLSDTSSNEGCCRCCPLLLLGYCTNGNTNIDNVHDGNNENTREFMLLSQSNIMRI